MKLSVILSFVGGLAVGVAGTAIAAKIVYEKKIDSELETMRDFYKTQMEKAGIKKETIDADDVLNPGQFFEDYTPTTENNPDVDDEPRFVDEDVVIMDDSVDIKESYQYDIRDSMLWNSDLTLEIDALTESTLFSNLLSEINTTGTYYIYNPVEDSYYEIEAFLDEDPLEILSSREKIPKRGRKPE